jgi:hypothetical protein
LDDSLARLSALGLGPFPESIRKRFKTLPLFRRACGLYSPDHVYERHGKFRGTAAIVAFARQLQASLDGRLPVKADYERAANTGDGPSISHIRKQIGGMGELRELLGYPNIRRWDDDDFIDWGVRVMEANKGTGLPLAFAVILSKRRRGPSDTTITSRFKRWDTFRESVWAEREERENERAEKIRGYREQTEDGRLPKGYGRFSETTLVVAAAKYILAQRLTSLSPKDLRALPRDTDAFVDALIQANINLTPGRIETEAVMMGIFDDIWDMNSLAGLKVEAHELRRYQQEQVAYKRRQRAGRVATQAATQTQR